MSYIEMCNKNDRSPSSFSRQIRLKNVKLVPVSIDGNGNAIKYLDFQTSTDTLCLPHHRYFSKTDILCHGIC